MEKALLVSIQIKTDKHHWRIEDISSELEELAVSAGVEVADNIICICEKATANYLIGKGKVEEIGLIAAEENIDTIIFSHDLSGTQQRNLEDTLGRKTIDRTQLILDIFSRRAKSPEGKMQVELALLEYLLPRLTGKGVMLSRLGGGIGTRGPGETKLEVDRRQIRRRIDKLKTDIEAFRLHRLTTHKKRRGNNLPLVALVGYTSAGKSTLLNRLTDAGQTTSEKLFTTLDPLSKNLKLPNGQDIIISDTVGFLHELPHHLIEAFKATLEEVSDADLLIHVLDVSDQRIHQHNQAVQSVLDELGLKDKPILAALNKMDLIADRSWLEVYKNEFKDSVILSAKSGENVDALIESIQRYFSGLMLNLKIIIPHSRMELVDFFYRQAKVDKIDYLQEGIRISLRISRELFSKISKDRDIKVIC
ncbi:MAG: GTPase HflX [Candidatus Omnitrophica bacterium]|jgi:GTP-binding protein HflX|nr:GTPase HflX [Candidatus Omnitrophota bacterium]MDD5252949.1 GTPase HflX [Candidatus Omnitrophota bacterium]